VGSRKWPVNTKAKYICQDKTRNRFPWRRLHLLTPSRNASWNALAETECPLRRFSSVETIPVVDGTGPCEAGGRGWDRRGTGEFRCGGVLHRRLYKYGARYAWALWLMWPDTQAQLDSVLWQRTGQSAHTMGTFSVRSQRDPGWSN